MGIDRVRSRLNRQMESAIASKSSNPNRVLYYAGIVDGQHYARNVPSVADGTGARKVPVDWRLPNTPAIDTAIAVTFVGQRAIAIGVAR